ncbi:MAG TPA: nucleoside/nucleotide kinase family protein [Propionibacteriaceae bacterium]|nr:nucleoside/nucleotide kinase family protein [Propionibacteriaceae bacterium]
MQQTTWRGSEVGHLVERAERLLHGEHRMVLGIAGAPASGKSTLAELVLGALDAAHPGKVVGVGMDAFHIGHRILEQRGQVGVKGAPHTFDVTGYVALLRRIRMEKEAIYAPEFHRDIEDSLAHTVQIGPEVRLVVTEGNYLLLPRDPWRHVRPLLDEGWFVFLDDEERQHRMLARHLSFGHSLADAERRTFGSDEVNARLVNAAQNFPDLWVTQLV